MSLRAEGTNDYLPNLIIAGVPKAGTTSIHGWLSDHPMALGSYPKETNFFVDRGAHMFDPSRHIDRGLSAYKRCFRAKLCTVPSVVFEATPSYVYQQTALQRLPELPGRPHFVFVVREPASQIYSLFSYCKNNWNWIPPDMSFDAFVEAVREGNKEFRGNELLRHALRNARYVDQLEAWAERAGRARMQVRLFEELRSDPKRFMKSLAASMGLDAGFYEEYEFRKANEGYRVKSRVVQQVNIALRGRMPDGSIYRFARRLYRFLNTSTPQEPDERERETLEGLRLEYRDANTRLAEAFDLDLSAWGSR
ncbi:MAG: sulfotransferase [Thiohalocapsa sp.]|nr:sulfotransferase [Thiohalocapsa sp.]